jgi:SAM-dependent methyltransferase
MFWTVATTQGSSRTGTGRYAQRDRADKHQHVLPPTTARDVAFGANHCATCAGPRLRGGAFAAAVKERTGAEVWGIEFNPQAAEHARALVDHVLVGDADERIAELPDTYFDAIVCNDILEHLVNPGATLTHLRRKLKPEGVVVASIPNIRFAPALSKVVFRKDSPAGRRRHLRPHTLALLHAQEHRATVRDSRLHHPAHQGHQRSLRAPQRFADFPKLRILR